MAKVKKWIWKLVETDEYVDVPDHIPPVGKATGKYSLPVVAVDPGAPAGSQTVITAWSTGLDGNERVEMMFPAPKQLPTPKSTLPPSDTEKAIAEIMKLSENKPADPLGLGPPPKLANWNPQWEKALPTPVAQRTSDPAGIFDVLDHPYIGGKFTIFVLGYGDHLDLVERCIGSIVDTCPRERFDIRVALNQPSVRVDAYAQGLFQAGIITMLYTDFGDRKKYPAMREMFWDNSLPITTPYVCWFDDDSWCRARNWMVLLAESIKRNHPNQGRLYGAWMYHDLMSVKKHNPTAAAEKWFREAPWWKGRNFYSGGGTRTSPNGSQIAFASGGFWALATHVIREANIPDERLVHNGGDITIGAQVTQAGYKVVNFSPRPGKDIIAWSDAPPRGTSHKGPGRKEFPWSVS